jgi:hypothetical protein
MMTKRNALLAAGLSVLVAVAGERAAGASDQNWSLDDNGDVPWDAIAGGRDTNGQILYFCRAFLFPGYQPGKVSGGLGTCNYPYGGAERKDPNYEVLVPHWEAASSGQLTANPYQGGTDADGAPLYVCRAKYDGGLQPGKLKQGAGCYIAYAGNETLLNDYEVLQQDLPMLPLPNTDISQITGGYEKNQSVNLDLCIANYNDGTISSQQPGKYLHADHLCHFSYAGGEILTDNFNFVILRHYGSLQGAAFDFVAGQDTNGQPLYACTASIPADNYHSTQLGKYRKDFSHCHVGWGGKELGDAANAPEFLVD